MTRGKSVLLLLAAFLVFNLAVFPLAVARIDPESRGGPPLDLRFGYSPDTAYAVLDAYGAEGRRAYLWVELTADVVYPAVYALLLALSVAYLLEKARRPAAAARRAAILPAAALVADYLENLGIVVMLVRYPERSDVVAGLTSAITSAKWVLFLAAVGALVWAAGAFVRARRRGQAAP